MPIIQIIIDDSTSKVITGSYEFDRANGGTLLVPSGSAFPGTPAAKELFWRTDESKLYRRNDANDAWVAAVAAVAAHKTTHEPGGSDAMTVDAAAGTGSLRTLGTTATSACAGNDARLSDARTPAAHATSHKHGGSDEVATATPAANAIPKADGFSKLDGWVTANAAAGTPSLRQLGTGATDACAGNDGRLSDARTPTAHKTSHEPGGSDALTVDAAAGTGSLRTLGTGATAACAGNDSRLSDSRTPTAHSTSHKNGGSDEVATATAAANAIPKAAAGGKLDIGWVPLGATSTTVCVGNDSRLSDARTPTAHASSHQPGGGDAMAVDAAAGTGSLRTLGTAATSACAGNDSRLSDARTPTAHATSHKSGGADSIKLDELAAPTDITTLDATTGQHGLLPKLGGGTTNYLRADGTWATPSGSTAVFGADYQIEVVEGTSTTTSATMQDKVTLTTPALTGTYRVSFFCEIMIGAEEKRHQCRLYNVTDAAELCFDDSRPSLASMYTALEGFQNVTFAGAAKTFKIQFASQGGSATVTIRRARLELWRVS